MASAVGRPRDARGRRCATVDPCGWTPTGAGSSSRAARHGAFGTVHADRGVDAVPVVFVVDGEQIVIPIDTVKPKAGPRLQRLRNLDADHRAVLLVDHYDDDWSQLWWVRVHGHAREAEPTADAARAARGRLPRLRGARHA